MINRLQTSRLSTKLQKRAMKDVVDFSGRTAGSQMLQELLSSSTGIEAVVNKKSYEPRKSSRNSQ